MKFKTKLSIISIILISTYSFAQNNVKINCDSIYQNKEIKVNLLKITNTELEKPNYIFKIKKGNEILIKDSIYSKVGKIEFKDFNNDNCKDILVQNISDFRSNWTYYLYLYIPKNHNFKRIMGFQKIKNPEYNSKYNIIESYVLSGQDKMYFFKIINGSIKQFKISIVDDHKSGDFEREYKKALDKITE